jgi:hypothetical protein
MARLLKGAAIMKQILKSDLDDVLATLNNMTNNTQGFSIDADCDGYQLVKENRIVSCGRLNKRGMYDFISAYGLGIEDGQALLKRFELNRMLEKMGANK